MILAICDDNINDLNIMNQLVLEYCNENQYQIEIKLYSDVEKLFKNATQINCLILDVLLCYTTGIEVARKLFDLNKDIKIIFCSINPEYSIEAFEVNAFRYLIKPINKHKLFQYLDEIRKYYTDFIITFNDINHRCRTISIFDITYIDMHGRYSTVHLKNKTNITVIRQMKEWIDILDNSRFCLCYKGILVNLKYVSSLTDKLVILNNGESVYLSRTYKKEFQTAFYNMLGEML